MPDTRELLKEAQDAGAAFALACGRVNVARRQSAHVRSEIRALNAELDRIRALLDQAAARLPSHLHAVE